MSSGARPSLQSAASLVPKVRLSVSVSLFCLSCPVCLCLCLFLSSCDSWSRPLPSLSCFLSPSLPLSASLSPWPFLPLPPLPLPGSFGFSSDVFIMDTIGGGEVSLGDLADLTVTNDNDLSCDVSSWGALPWASQLAGPWQSLTRFRLSPSHGYVSLFHSPRR